MLVRFCRKKLLYQCECGIDFIVILCEKECVKDKLDKFKATDYSNFYLKSHVAHVRSTAFRLYV
jgi:hypothetical protein